MALENMFHHRATLGGQPLRPKRLLRRIFLTTAWLLPVGAPGMIGPARADIVSTGTNFPVPVVSGAPSMVIGNGAAGTLTVNDASGPQVFNGNSFAVGNGNNGVGTATFTGAGTTATFSNPASPGGSVQLGIGTGSNGTLTVNNGATFIATSPDPTRGFGFNLGGSPTTSGGTGSLIVDAAAVHFVGPFNNNSSNQALNVGLNLGTGTVTLRNGGILDGVNAVLVGRDGSTGTLNVTGAGSKLTTVKTGTLGGGVNAGFVASAAQQATLGPLSNGTVNVSAGGQIYITLDTAGSFLQAGRRGSTGTINITGAGSNITMEGANGGTTSGIAIGRNSSGTLNITAGGALIVNDTGPGTLTMAIGGNPAQVTAGETAGTGTVLVSGAGSKIDFSGTAHGNVAVGYASTGTGGLTVNGGGGVSVETMVVGRNPGATGTLTVTGAGSQITLAGNYGPVLAGGNQNLNGGARLVVGGAGTGSASITNGGSVVINPTTPPGASPGGLFIGGGVMQSANVLPANTNIAAGGSGTLSVTGGSGVTIGGSATNSVIVVGGNGTGTLTIDGASSVALPGSGAMYVGAPIPGVAASVPLTGSVIVANGSSLNAGSLLGIGSNGVGNNNTGTGSVLMTGNSTITATSIVIGQGGLFGGNGTVNGNVTNNGGTLRVGASPDSLIINGAFTQIGGHINLEVFSDGFGGFLTNELVFTQPGNVSLTGVTFDYQFINVTDPNLFFLTHDLGTFLRGSSDGGLTDVGLDPAQLNAIVAANSFTVSQVPEPGTLALFGLALAGLACTRRRGAEIAPAGT